jgi:hypothetical protein
LQAPKKVTQIRIFGFENIPSGNPAVIRHLLLTPEQSNQNRIRCYDHNIRPFPAKNGFFLKKNNGSFQILQDATVFLTKKRQSFAIFRRNSFRIITFCFRRITEHIFTYNFLTSWSLL